MHTQRRYGAPSRPRNDHHTVWEHQLAEPRWAAYQKIVLVSLLIVGASVVWGAL